MGIDNIHVMRDSFNKLREACYQAAVAGGGDYHTYRHIYNRIGIIKSDVPGGRSRSRGLRRRITMDQHAAGVFVAWTCATRAFGLGGGVYI